MHIANQMVQITTSLCRLLERPECHMRVPSLQSTQLRCLIFLTLALYLTHFSSVTSLFLIRVSALLPLFEPFHIKNSCAAGLSSFFFAFADLVIHSIFDTDYADPTVNKTSSYLDLSPLYGSSDKSVDAVRRKDGTGRLWEDVIADSRLLFMPPSVCALLVLFCRNHNVCRSFLDSMVYVITNVLVHTSILQKNCCRSTSLGHIAHLASFLPTIA